MAGPRRMAPPPPPPAVEGVNFGSLGFYAGGGFSLPKGKYALEFNAIMFAPVNAAGVAQKARLGVQLVAYPLEGGDPTEQFLSMGSRADQSFAPNNTGKGLTPIPGGPASTLQRNTNWNLFLKSLYDCGLPEGIFTNDLSVLDGVWVQTDLVPEPEERKGYGQAKTGEAEAQEERRGSGLIPSVAEILEGGKPWEGGGGFPAAVPVAPAAPSRVAAPARAAAQTRPAMAPRTAAIPVAVEQAGDDDVMTAAVNGMTTVLEAEPNGTSKLKLRTGTFKAVGAASGNEMAQAVIDTYFGSDENLNTVLGQLGYGVQGSNIKPV